jgi:hypothetical protein
VLSRGGIGMVQKTMPPIELAERLALLLALAFFLGLAFEETYKREEPTIPGGIRTFPLIGLAEIRRSGAARRRAAEPCRERDR